ncbi:hypothetical protein [Kiloniella sp. b19]|uniref:hypothetical protein n=1 Tax=Kiloniella sp. GXU_MW_B19 TaxID=3141326 RepID=UPI0031D3622C
MTNFVAEQSAVAPVVAGPVTSGDSLLMRILLFIPIVGWIIRELRDPNSGAHTFFFLNVLFVYVLAGYFFGIQGVYHVALVMVPTMIVTIIVIANGKLIGPVFGTEDDKNFQ